MRAFFALILLFASTGYSAEKPFRTVYVLSSGSTYDTAVILGVLNGLESRMTGDDLILATNASAIAASIFLSFDNAKARTDYLKSDKYHAFLNSWKTKGLDISSNLKMAQLKKHAQMPWLVSMGPVQDIDPFVLPGLPAAPNNGKLPSLMTISARANFDLKDSKVLAQSRADWRKTAAKQPFTIVGFADKAVIAKIQNSGAALDLTSHYCTSEEVCIDSKMEFLESSDFSEATRATLANAPLMKPFAKNGQTFVGGAVDHDPVDLARSLSRQDTVVTYSGPAGVEKDAMLHLYNYDINEWREKYASFADIQVVDLSKFFNSTPYKKRDMSLKLLMFPQLPDLETYQETVDLFVQEGESIAKGLALP